MNDKALKEDGEKAVSIFLGYRKFMVMLMVVFISVVFRVANYIDGGQMVDLLKGAVLGFFAGNAMEYSANTVTSAFKSFLPNKGSDASVTQTTISETEVVPDDPDATN
jgi:hypothetical protein